jgi:hypothetical protein
LKTRLLEKAIETRRELFVFALLVSVWGVIIGAFGGALYTFAKLWLWEWALARPVVAFGLGFLLFAVLVAGGAVLLARWLGGTDTRIFKMVLPVMVFTERIEMLGIEGYRVLEGICERFAKAGQAGLMDSYRKSLSDSPGDPFHGELHQKVGAAMSDEMIRTVSRTCESLLSESAPYHGFDFRSLAKPPGPCARVAVEGVPGLSIHLPHGCRAKAQPSAPDNDGDTILELIIQGPFGQARFSVSPQWAHLSDAYHHRSLELATNRMKTDVKNYSLCVANKIPTLWPLEVPVQLCAQMASNPLFLISKKSDAYALWIGEMLDRLESRLSWRIYMERSMDRPDRDRE